MSMIDNKIGRTTRGNITISTIEVNFLAWYGPYETAISFDGENIWKVAKAYATEEDAIKGHEMYSNMTDEELLKIDFIDQ